MVASINTNPSTQVTDGLPLMDSTAGESVDSFAQQLATALEGYLNKTGGSNLQIQVQRQNSDASQFTVTIDTPSIVKPSESTPTPAATTPTPATSTAPTADSTTTTTTTTSTSTSTSTLETGTMPTAAELAKMTPDQAYWAEQPPAVQALQTMPDDQRYSYAQQLASEGYSIDVPIMVWGWDPLATMVMRQNDGLTWVPSGLQPNIPVAPGDSFPGLPSYDPTNPPPGSIPVTTAFAIGTNGQDPWVPTSTTSAS
jgi:hypothetical protein